MGVNLILFFITLLAVFIICIAIAKKRQSKTAKFPENIVLGADNHIMKTKRYSGKYTTCEKIGEVDD